MSNIQSHYIDFRAEHRIYLLEGVLWELVGMLADTDYDDWDEKSISDDPSPRTWYKFVFDSEFMYDGGHYPEGSLPGIFAHRGDTLSTVQIGIYLLGNIYYNNDSPICLLEGLKAFDLKADFSVADIKVRFLPIGNGYNIETDLQSFVGWPPIFVRPSPDGKKGLVFSVANNEEFYSYKRLATRMGRILYALREYFGRDVEITSIVGVKDVGSSKESEYELSPSFHQFFRLVNIAADVEKDYWKERLK